MPSAKMDLMRSLQNDAEGILQARSRGGLLVEARDIKAAGNETETAVRLLLKRRLPKRFRVAHGHVMDSNYDRSAQVDVIIVDDAACPVLFDAEDGSEFVPIEAVCAVAEVKAGYRSGDLGKWLSDSAAITALHRQDMPAKIRGDKGSVGSRRGQVQRFMVIADGSGLNVQSQIEELVDSDRSCVPICICILSGEVQVPNGKPSTTGGVILLRDVSESTGKPGKLTVHPIHAGAEARWVFIGFSGEQAAGTNLGVVYGLLISHLRGSQREIPDLWPYLELPPNRIAVGPAPA